jgi:hypothetical protein
VAVAVVARLLVSAPLVLLVAGRKGPVRARDMARTLVAPAAAAAAAFVAAVGARLLLAPSSPLTGLLLSAAFAAPAALLVLRATRSGRRALRDALAVVTESVPKRRDVTIGGAGGPGPS